MSKSIKTTRKGDKITKVCKEDCVKLVNRVLDSINKATENTVDIVEEKAGIIYGIGRSKPCLSDAFDEELGNNIAFMKAKLNANIKKHNILCRIYNQYVDVLDAIGKELIPVDNYILKDLEGVRKHNPTYLEDIEYKLGIY